MRVDWTDLSLIALVALITVKVGIPTYTDWVISREEASITRRLTELSATLASFEDDRVYFQSKGDESFGVLRLPGTIELGFGSIKGKYVEGEIIEVDDDRRLVMLRGK